MNTNDNFYESAKKWCITLVIVIGVCYVIDLVWPTSREAIEERYDTSEIANLDDNYEYDLEVTADNKVTVKEIYYKTSHKQLSKPYKMSTKGHDFIKGFETCKLKAYHIKGEKYNTIGWGHYMMAGDKTPNKITQAKADKLFVEDIQEVNESVNRLLDEINPNFRPTQGFIDGLGSLVYNCGENGVRKTRFFQRFRNCRFDKNGNVNKADWDYTLAAVKTANVSMPGHVKRRIGEYKLMKS